SNAHDGVRIEREALPFDVDLAPTPQHEVDLFLPVLGMVVLREALEVRREVHHLKAERLHSQLRAGALERAAEYGLHLVDLLDGVAPHQGPFCRVDPKAY